VPGEVSDQEVLRALDNWSRTPGPENALVSRLCEDEQFASVWDHFSYLLPDYQVCDLADEVIAFVIGRDGAKAAGDNPGVRALARRAGATSRRDTASREWLESKVRSALPVSIRLCTDLYLDWAAFAAGIIAPGDRDAVRRAMIDAAKGTFTVANPKALLDALDDAVPYALYQFVCVPGDERAPSSASDAASWQWLGPVLLAAAKLQPGKMIPQLAHLVCDTQHGPRGQWSVQIVDQRVAQVFGEGTNALISLLSQPVDTPVETDKEYLRLAREQAIHWKPPQLGPASPG
jgi:hypothetical protein